MRRRYEGRLVLVTGAGGGLGRAICSRFSEEGAAVIASDADGVALDETAALVRATGGQCFAHRVDLADESQILEFGQKVCRDHSKLDALVNNAGIAYGEITTGFETLTQRKWLQYFAVNTVAPLILAQALRVPLAAARGVIINQSSMASYIPGTAYGVTKAALNSITYGMAQAFGAEGIRAVAIAPGMIETPASRSELSADVYSRVQSQQLLKLDGSSDDIAQLALFLASDDARFITSEVITCDGGNRIRGWRG